MKLFSLLLAVFLSGCSAEQLAREEAVAHAALAQLEHGIDWANANPDTVNALLDDASKASSDPGFKKAIDKAKLFVEVGDMQKAKEIVSLGKAITAPTK